ncbi:MAG TPA: ABC transporter permease [Ruminococcus sp.]|nr:ABC transporter permease [Ruminococcus sp.]
MNKMISRSFSKKKIQTAGIVLLTFLWMFVASMSVNLYSANNKFQKDYFSETNAEDLEFVPAEGTDVEALAAKYDLDYEERYINELVSDGVSYRVISSAEKIDKPHITDGNSLSAAGEILVNKEYADKHDISAADTVTISGKSYKVAGIMTLPDYIRMHVRNDSLSYDPENEALIMASAEDTAAIEGGKLSVVYKAKFKDISDEKISDHTSELVRSRELASVTFRADNSNINALGGKISIYFMLTVISLCIMSVMIAVMLIMFIYILIGENKKNVGVLVANGLPRRKVFFGYLKAVAGLMLPAAVAGYITGSLFAPVFNRLLETDLSLPEMKFSFEPLFFGVFMWIVFFVGIIAAVFGTRSILKLSVVDMLRDTKVTGISRFERFVKKLTKKSSIEKKIKTSFAIRSKLLLVLVLFSVFAAGVEFFLSYSIYRFPKNICDAQEESMDFESQVYFRQPAEKSTEGDQYFYELKAMGKGKKDDVIVTVTALEDGALLDIGGHPSAGEAILNKTSADVLKAKKGDNIKLEIYDKEIEVKVAGISDRVAGKEIFIDHAWLAGENVIENKYNGMFTSDASITVDSSENYSSVLTKSSILESYESSQQVMKYGSIILGVLGILIPVILIAVTVSVLISQNKKEIYVFKANGIKNKIMNRMVYGSYNGFLLLGIIISIPYSFFILNLICSIAVKASGVRYPSDLDAVGIGFAVLMTFIVYFGTMLVLRLKHNGNMEKILNDFREL